MRAKREQEQKGNYRYYDTIHREYIDVPDELRPILAQMDRHTRYLETAQYCHNHVYVISQLDYCEEQYFSYSDDGFEAILDSMCASKYWTEIASILSDDEMTLLLEIFVFGDLTFKRIHVTNDATLANHLRSKKNYTVTEVSDASELLEYLQDTGN